MSEALDHARRILAIHVAGGSLDSSPRSRYHYTLNYRNSVRYQIRDGSVSELVSRPGSIQAMRQLRDGCMPQSYQLHLLDRFAQPLLLDVSDTKLTGKRSVGSQAQSNLWKAGHLCTSLVDMDISLGEVFFLIP